jgi:hypothetical protein
MDDSVHAVYQALLQRFQVLTTEFRQNHAAWQEAVRRHDLPSQLALIARHRAILTEAREVMAAFLAPRAQHHR